MTRRRIFFFLFMLLSILAIGSLAQKEAQAKQTKSLKRFALVVGANDGGRERVRLRYAGKDAASFAQVLSELGGVTASDSIVLFDPDRSDLYQAFDAMAAKMQSAKKAGWRNEVFFYYSGHSDMEGLLLYGRHLLYKDLKNRIEALPADVRVVILDSCSSGAMTRLKGGKMRPPFLVDTSSDLKGNVLLTSASASEAAQESDKIQGSFFTHYLLSGMRGAADVTGDGKVTLNEAYQYSFYQTLGRTQKTKVGPQHANYDIKLTGTGDLVLTQLRGENAGVLFSEDIAGKLFIQDENAKLIAELEKIPSASVQLALKEGRYRAYLHKDEKVYEARFGLQKGKHKRLAMNEFQPVKREQTIARGGVIDETSERKASIVLSVEQAKRPKTLAKLSEKPYFTKEDILIAAKQLMEKKELGSDVRLRLMAKLKETIYNTPWIEKKLEKMPVMAVMVYLAGEGGFLFMYQSGEGLVRLKSARQLKRAELKSWSIGLSAGGSGYWGIGLFLGLHQPTDLWGVYKGHAKRANAATASAAAPAIFGIDDPKTGNPLHELLLVNLGAGFAGSLAGVELTIAPRI